MGADPCFRVIVDVDVVVHVDASSSQIRPKSWACGENTDGVFGFERLDVYQRAIEFVGLAAKIIMEVPPGHHPYTDQLRRAALSIPVNIAEGVGRPNPGDRRGFYGIARGSAMECAAILDACRVIHAASDNSLSQGRALLFRIVSRLTKMCR